MSLAVGYDGSESAERALATAISLAKDLSESLLVVCGVAPGGGMGEEYAITEAAVVDQLAPFVQAGVAKAAGHGIVAEAVLVNADPVGALETVMEQRKPRMLIVGYGQTGRIQAALFGAVAHRIVERADIPVVVVP